MKINDSVSMVFRWFFKILMLGGWWILTRPFSKVIASWNFIFGEHSGMLLVYYFLGSNFRNSSWIFEIPAGFFKFHIRFLIFIRICCFPSLEMYHCTNTSTACNVTLDLDVMVLWEFVKMHVVKSNIANLNRLVVSRMTGRHSVVSLLSDHLIEFTLP